MDDDEIRYWASGGRIGVCEAARILGVSRRTVVRMVGCGVLIGWRPNPAGRKLLLYRRQVEGLAVREQRSAVKRARALQGVFAFF